MEKPIVERMAEPEPPAELSEEQQKMLLAIKIMRPINERNLSDAEAADIAGAGLDEVKAIRSRKFDEVDLFRLREMVSQLSQKD